MSLASIGLKQLHVKLVVQLLTSFDKSHDGVSVGGRWFIFLVLDVWREKLSLLLSVVELLRLLRSGLPTLEAVGGAGANVVIGRRLPNNSACRAVISVDRC